MKSVSTILLAAIAGVDRSVLALELEASPNLPQVPQVKNADKNGFPTIRSVQSVMEGYKMEKDRLNHEAAALGLGLKKVEKEDADRIVQQNTVYLEKLKEQEKKNQVVSVENAKVAKLIMDVRKGNDKVSAVVQKEEKLIKLRRSQFAALKKKFLEGQERVNKLLEGSDTSKEMALLQVGEEDSRTEDQAPMSFLEVVQEGARRNRLHAQVGELDIEASPIESADLPTSELDAASIVDEKVSTDQIGMVMVGTSSMDERGSGWGPPVHLGNNEASSEKLEVSSSSFQTGFTELESATSSQINSLAKQASKLSEATAHSLAELKASFQETYKAGARRQQALMKQQKALKESLKSAEEQFAKLKATYHQVTGLRQGLEKELQKNGAFLGEVQKMAAL